MAGPRWGGRMMEMIISPAVSDSIESKLNQIDLDGFYLFFDDKVRKEENLMVTGHRAVGVVYNSSGDRRQFVPTIIPMRYDTLFFFKNTSALRVLR